MKTGSFFKRLLVLAVILHTASIILISAQSAVNPNASVATCNVLEYIHSIQGEGLLSGQENLATDVSYWTDLVYDITGKYPALLGEDWSYGDEAYKKRLNIVEAATEYWEMGGLVTISWHQVNPDTWDGSINEGSFSDSQEPMTQERFDELLTPGTDIYNKYLAHIDTIAGYLDMLQDAGVVVLWRPYHEMNGGWFWWGGKNNFPELWKLMYNRFTEYHHLNNLIWVWSANLSFGVESRELENYYPGEEWVDINGLDGYNNRTNWDTSSDDSDDLDKIIAFKENNPIAFTELGTLPDPDWVSEDRPEATWFLCWWTHIVDNHTEAEILEAYDHPYVLTRDELPVLTDDGKLSFRLKESVESLLASAEEHLSNAIDEYSDYSAYPASNDQEGNLNTVSASDWVSGFFPGCLWYMYEYSQDDKFKTAAQNWTAGLESQQNSTGTHDLGFMMYCSYGNGFRLTGDENYRDVLIQSAESLNGRFNSTIGCIRSWDFGDWEYPVIIDNMMNLELLTWAGKSSGNTDLLTNADTHAQTTLINHFRSDYSSYHVVDYDMQNGSVIGKGTYQGYSDESAWARGQAWGLYGYTMMFRETGDSSYLDQAINIADYFIDRLPEDYVPYWDFDAPDIPDELKDASSAAICASALMELYQYCPENGNYYLRVAENIIQSLGSSDYFAEPESNNNFLLKHSTGNKPANGGVDVAQIYADYYFLEALLRYRDAGRQLSALLPDLSLQEDAGTTEVVPDLIAYYGLEGEENLSIDLYSNNSNMVVELSESNALSVSYPENYSGTSSVTVKISLDSIVLYDGFMIEVVGVNDKPEAAVLISPTNGVLLRDLGIIYDWSDAIDIDGDILSYDLHISGPGLDTLFTDLTSSKYKLDGTEIFEGSSTYTWSVWTDDGIERVESESFTFITPELSSVHEIESLIEVSVFPNPFTESLNISFGLVRDAVVKLNVYDGMGRLVINESESYQSGEHSMILDTQAGLESGSYLLILKVFDGTQEYVYSTQLIRQ